LFEDIENIFVMIDSVLSNMYIFNNEGDGYLSYYCGHNEEQHINIECADTLRGLVAQKSNEGVILLYYNYIFLLDLMTNTVAKQLNTGECIFSHVELNSDTILLLTGNSAMAYFLDIDDLHITKKLIFPGRDCNMCQYKYLCNQNYFVFQNRNGFYFYLLESFTYIGFCPRKYDNKDEYYYETTLIGNNLITYDLEITNNRITYFISNLNKLTDSISLNGTLIDDIVMLNCTLLIAFTDRIIFIYNTKTKSFLESFESRNPYPAYKTRYFKSKIITFIENSFFNKHLKLYDIKKYLLMISPLKVNENTRYCFNDKQLFTYGNEE
jgi:hypothetical protein